MGDARLRRIGAGAREVKDEQFVDIATIYLPSCEWHCPARWTEGKQLFFKQQPRAYVLSSLRLTRRK